jgi:hypothetical protein
MRDADDKPAMGVSFNAGVDTLEFSFDVELGQAMWDWLEEEKAIA